MNITEQIAKLLSLSPPDFNGIDLLLQEAAPISQDALTQIAVDVVGVLNEDIQNLYTNGGNPSDETLHSLPAVHLPQLLELLLKHGLNPNHWEYESAGYGRNILSTVGFIHAVCIQVPSMLMLLENGADPNAAPTDDKEESIFDEADLLPSQFPGEMNENPWIFSRWLLLMAFGGICSNGHEPVTMLNGYTRDVFRNCDEFWYRLKQSAPDGSTEDKWYLYIYDRATNQDVAFI